MDEYEEALREAALYEAAAWRIQLAEHGVKTTPAFAAWLSRERNAEAWAQTQALWSALETLGDHPKIIAHRRGARLRAGGRRIRMIAFSGALAAAVAGVFVASSAYERLSGWDTIATPSAQRRVVVLGDGSRLVLDAGTRLQVRLDKAARDIRLESGQARFDVSHDTRRPFRVHVDGRVVTALGTSFTVDRTKGAVSVVLLQGRVSVADDPQIWSRAPFVGPPAPPTLLRPGQRAAITDDGPSVRVQTVALGAATAWEEGRLVFDNETLPAAAERASRYSAAPIRVSGPETAELRVSGIFDAGDTGAFVDAVARYFDLEAETDAKGAVTLRSRSKNSP